MLFAAFDTRRIYGVGASPLEASMNARADHPDALDTLLVAPMTAAALEAIEARGLATFRPALGPGGYCVEATTAAERLRYFAAMLAALNKMGTADVLK
jgi:hypothetical protein